MPYSSAEYENDKDSFDRFYNEVYICEKSSAAHFKEAIQIRNREMVDQFKMLNGTWLAYLEEIDTSAKEMVDRLIKDMAVKQGITEELKAKDQMAWVGAMNYIRHSAEEIVMRYFACSMK